MFLRIIFISVAALSLIFLVGYLILGSNISLLDVPSSRNNQNSNDSVPNSTDSVGSEFTRFPDSIASVKDEKIADAPVTENSKAEEIADGFFEMTDNEKLYGVFYDKQSGNFTITLYGLDTKKARESAESYILKNLPYSKNEWCGFVVNVLTNQYENPQWAGQQLGLSFCPGAVQL